MMSRIGAVEQCFLPAGMQAAISTNARHTSWASVEHTDKLSPLPQSRNPKQIFWFTLRQGDPVMDKFADWIGDGRNISSDSLLVVDGFEQLSLIHRLSLIWQTKRKRCGLLVTSHRPFCGLRVIYRSAVEASKAQQVAASACIAVHSESGLDLVRSANWDRLLLQHNGSLRECFMNLYDQFERQAKLPNSGAVS
jgi:hypothetical protein